MLHWSMILTIAKNLEIIPNHIQVKEKWVNAILLDVYVNYLIQLKMNVQKPVDQKIIKIGNIVKCNTLFTFFKKIPKIYIESGPKRLFGAFLEKIAINCQSKTLPNISISRCRVILYQRIWYTNTMI